MKQATIDDFATSTFKGLIETVVGKFSEAVLIPEMQQRVIL